MLSKLLKYEFKSTCRTFGLVYAVMLILCILTGLTDRLNAVLPQGLPIWSILLFLTVLFLFAAVIVTTVLNVSRFYKGLFKSEGYLIHTLPVHPWQILTAKLIPAVVWTIATVLVMAVSGFLAVVVNQVRAWSDVSAFFHAVGRFFTSLTWPVVADGLQVLALSLLALMVIVLEVYAAIALGQLFSRRRVAWSVLIWFLLNLLQSTVNSVLPSSARLAAAAVVVIEGEQDAFSYGFAALTLLFWAVIFWAATQWVLTKKVNLE